MSKNDADTPTGSTNQVVVRRKSLSGIRLGPTSHPAARMGYHQVSATPTWSRYASAVPHRAIVALIWLVAAFSWPCQILADLYDPPDNYYNAAVGTGATLKTQLHDIIKGHTKLSYDSARTNLQITDADPNNPGHMLSVYDRVSIDVSSINPGGPIPGWDAGATWNREHTWPQSRGITSTSPPDGTDLFELRPSSSSTNGSRSNLNYGGAFGQPYGRVSDGARRSGIPATRTRDYRSPRVLYGHPL